MLRIPPLRTARFSLEMQESKIIDSIKLAKIPVHLNEEATTHLLKSIITKCTGIDDVNMWTVQERMFVSGHYIASIQDNNPDFEIGDGHYSDYMQGDKQFSIDQVDLGRYEDDEWCAVPFIGAAAMAIEQLHGEIDGIEGLSHWEFGMMAAQLVPNGEFLDYGSGDIEAQLLKRMLFFANCPESVFVVFQSMLFEANQKMQHLFEFSVDKDGVVAFPRSGLVDENGGARKMPYARFPAHTSITDVAKRLCGKPN